MIEHFHCNKISEASYTAGKLEFVIKVLFHENNQEPKRINNSASRDIFLFKGNVYLDDMRWWTIQRVRCVILKSYSQSIQ